MACFRPIQGYQEYSGGPILFKSPGSRAMFLNLPCGRCVGCRIEQSQAWAVRCMHECQMHEENCAITLTYDDDHVTSQLEYSDFQLFMKRLRKELNGRKVRFFMCGEYGDQFGRPHFHAMLFGYGFYGDRKEFKDSKSGIQLYESEQLSKLWKKGHCLVQDADYEMAAYIARYVMKKMVVQKGDFDANTQFDIRTGEIIDSVAEFGSMSLRPAIGLDWLRKYRSDITNTNTLVVAGREVKVPRFYKKVLKEEYLEEYKSLRKDLLAKAERFKDNTTVERLLVREEVANQRMSRKKREFL